MKNLWTRIVLSSVVAGGLILAAGVPAMADRDYKEDCHRRLEADRARIDRDTAKHGEHSGQVNNDMKRLDNDRRWCRNHKADWDHDRFDIGISIHK